MAFHDAQVHGKTLDMRGDPLKACGEADILFPTNFAHLATLVGAASHAAGGDPGRAVAHATTGEFMRRWHAEKLPGATTAADGYDPLVDDYSNTAVLTTMGM